MHIKLIVNHLSLWPTDNEDTFCIAMHVKSTYQVQLIFNEFTSRFSHTVLNNSLMERYKIGYVLAAMNYFRIIFGLLGGLSLFLCGIVTAIAKHA